MQLLIVWFDWVKRSKHYENLTEWTCSVRLQETEGPPANVSTIPWDYVIFVADARAWLGLLVQQSHKLHHDVCMAGFGSCQVEAQRWRHMCITVSVTVLLVVCFDSERSLASLPRTLYQQDRSIAYLPSIRIRSSGPAHGPWRHSVASKWHHAV
jgi:hypothetical protein